MNLKTNFYGAIGLASTVGKNGFAFGKNASYYSATTCQYVRPVIDLKLGGYDILENLEIGARKIEKFDEEKEKSCQAWEEWAEKEYEAAKAEEELHESWRKLNNQPTNFEKACKFAKKAGNKLDHWTWIFLSSVGNKLIKTKNFLSSVAKKWWPTAKAKDLVRRSF